MKKIIIILAFGLFRSSILYAQITIGETREQIRKEITSNPNFKLLPGENCDTLNFTQGMKAIFYYKNNVCYSSASILPLKYASAVLEKMSTDSYKKIADDKWINANETVKVSVVLDRVKEVCVVTTTSYEKTVK